MLTVFFGIFQVFFVIRLHTPQRAAQLPDIHDPDPLISCELMDGRDAFLTIARDRHYEFSSLRRTKFSSMAMLYELHNQSQDRFIYTCNSCKTHVETRFHCTVCDVSCATSCCYLAKFEKKPWVEIMETRFDRILKDHKKISREKILLEYIQKIFLLIFPCEKVVFAAVLISKRSKIFRILINTTLDKYSRIQPTMF